VKLRVFLHNSSQPRIDKNISKFFKKIFFEKSMDVGENVVTQMFQVKTQILQVVPQNFFGYFKKGFLWQKEHQ
jgi:hypothetical protein